MRLVGANPRPQIEGDEELGAKSHYFSGDRPSRWVTQVPQYGRVRYRQVYPGVDLVFRTASGGLEYDWIVGPGRDPNVIRVTLSGFRLESSGDLIARGGGRVARLYRPAAYQEDAAGRREVAVAYGLHRDGSVGLKLGPYDASKTLVVDPVLSYATLFGGSGVMVPVEFGPERRAVDEGRGLAVDRDGNAYVAGSAISPDFPPVNTALPKNERYGAFVAKLSPQGSLMYVAFLGGAGGASANAIAVDSEGSAYVVGIAGQGFPVLNALQSAHAGQLDAFVTKLNPSGSALVYSTYLGGTERDSADAMALDSVGRVYLAGVGSRDFPTVPPAPARSTGVFFIAKIGPAGNSLVYSSPFPGGSPSAIATDSTGNVYVAGGPSRLDLPTTAGALQRGCASAIGGSGSCYDAFVAKLNATGSALLYATYLGGRDEDYVRSVTVDPAGNAYVAGFTSSSDFPTTPGAFLTAGAFSRFSGPQAFVAKLNATGTALVYSTYLGGTLPARPDAGGVSQVSRAGGIAIGEGGSAYVVGHTNSPDFPLVKPLQAFGGGTCSAFSFGGPLIPCYDAFLAKLSPDGSRLLYSTFFGGSNYDSGTGVAVAGGNVYFSAIIYSGDVPATSRPQNPRGGILVARISEAADAPAFGIASVTNAASYVTGLTPGGIATLFGQTLSTVSGIAAAERFPLPTEIAGTSVTVNGVTAPLLAVANVGGQEQINFITPYEVAGRSTATITVTQNGIASLPIQLTLLSAHPGVFTSDGVHAVAQHSADYELVSSVNPAIPGEVLVLYATGLGPVQPPASTGRPAPAAPLSATVLTPSVRVGGAPAEVLFSGLTPGFAGLYQLNIRLPRDAPAGEVDLVVQVGAEASRFVKIFVTQGQGTQ